VGATKASQKPQAHFYDHGGHALVVIVKSFNNTLDTHFHGSVIIRTTHLPTGLAKLPTFLAVQAFRMFLLYSHKMR
jgi:hypothetical protein